MAVPYKSFKHRLLIENPVGPVMDAYNQGVEDAASLLSARIIQVVERISVPAFVRSNSPLDHGEVHPKNLEIRDAHDIKHACLEAIKKELR